jgi:hypothetical protein
MELLLGPNAQSKPYLDAEPFLHFRQLEGLPILDATMGNLANEIVVNVKPTIFFSVSNHCSDGIAVVAVHFFDDRRQPLFGVFIRSSVALNEITFARSEIFRGRWLFLLM